MKRKLEAVQSATAHRNVPEGETLTVAREIFASLGPADQREVIALAAALASQQAPDSDSRV